MRTHMPFRKWCPFCVRGKAKNQPHASASKSTREVLMIAYDYMKQRTEANRKGGVQTMPTIVGIDYDSGRVMAHMVQKKGFDK